MVHRLDDLPGSVATGAVEAERVRAALGLTADSAADLIGRFVEPYPWNPSRVDDAWIKGQGPQIYAIIQTFFTPDVDPQYLDAAAGAWCLPVDAVRAAITYYLQHRDAFDRRIEANQGPG